MRGNQGAVEKRQKRRTLRIWGGDFVMPWEWRKQNNWACNAKVRLWFVGSSMAVGTPLSNRVKRKRVRQVRIQVSVRGLP